MLTLHIACPSQSYHLYDVICTIDRVDAISVASQGLFSLLFFYGSTQPSCSDGSQNDLHMVQLTPLPPHHLLLSCFIKKLNSFTFLVLAYPGCPVNEAIKRMSVCLSVSQHWSKVTYSV